MAGMNADLFAAKLREYANKTVPKILQDVQVIVFYKIYEGVLQRNPVLTSLSRGNWFTSIGDPIIAQTKETAGLGPNDTGAPLTGREKTQVRDTIRELRNAPLGTVIWMANSIDYIRFLEQGSSMKAPQGMVQITLHSVLEEVRYQGVDIDVLR